MAIALGKRKRQSNSQVPEPSSDASDSDDMRARFQRAFEAKFKPLEKPIRPEFNREVETEMHDEQDDDSDWSGLSDDDREVDIVEQGTTQNTFDLDVDREMKDFMSSKPPSSKERVVSKKKPTAVVEADDGAESANLKHDLALQRLLKESHLLDHSAFSSSTATPEGKGRLKALDLRLQDLGAKKALSEQEKMPLAHRKGIKAKATSREASRRQEAAENGIVLEKAKAAVQAQKRRERGIGAPGVGSFKGGTLRLSSRDVRSIEGPKPSKGGKGRRK